MVCGLRDTGDPKKSFYKKKQHLIAVSTGPFGRVPTTRSLGDNNDHHGEFIMYPSLGMILQEGFGDLTGKTCLEIYLRPRKYPGPAPIRRFPMARYFRTFGIFLAKVNPEGSTTPKQRKKRTAGTKPSFGSMGFVVWIFLVGQLPSLKLTANAPENGWLEY